MEHLRDGMPASHGAGIRLDSWKAIASYLGRDVATVQRWEKREALPVKRHLHQKQASVYAYTNDLDAWRHRREPSTHATADRSICKVQASVVRRGASLFGRQAELDALRAELSLSLNGQQRFVLITGDAGAGKSALVDAFAATLAAAHSHFARGECIPHSGPGEPYRPFLIALERLAAYRLSPSVKAVLASHSPTWLLQLPSLIGSQERLDLHKRSAAPTRGRMLREFLSALHHLAGVHSVVLVLEDLQWADRSSLELLWAVARSRESASLLIIGTARPGELTALNPALQCTLRDLAAHETCRRIPLQPLTRYDVAEWVSERFGGDVEQALGTAVWERSEGHPLFVSNLLDFLDTAEIVVRDCGSVWRVSDSKRARGAFPATLRELISAQIACLNPQQREVLAAASVAGREFTLPAVAAVLDRPVADIQTVTRDLEQGRRFVERCPGQGVRIQPGVPVSRFIHELYQESFYELNPPFLRSVLHARLAAFVDRELSKWGVASEELASHYDRAGRPDDAIRCWRIAAETAIGRTAPAEAEQHIDRALALLNALAPSAFRDQEELLLQLCRGRVLQYLRGFTDPEVERVFSRAAHLSYASSNQSLAIPALLGLVRYNGCRGDLASAERLGTRAICLATQDGDRALAFDHHAQTLFYSGSVEEAIRLGDQALTIWNTRPPAPADFLHIGYDPWVATLSEQSWRLLWNGRSTEALSLARAALERARFFGHPETHSFACCWAALVFLSTDHVDHAADVIRCSERLTEEFRLATAAALTNGLHGTLLTKRQDFDHGIPMLHEFGEWIEQSGMVLFEPLQRMLLCQAYVDAGDAGQALAVAKGGLEFGDRTGIVHLKGDFLRLCGDAHMLNANGVGAHAMHRARARADYRDALVLSARMRAGRTMRLTAQSLLALVGVTHESLQALLTGLDLRQPDGSESGDEAVAFGLLQVSPPPAACGS